MAITSSLTRDISGPDGSTRATRTGRRPHSPDPTVGAAGTSDKTEQTIRPWVVRASFLAMLIATGFLYLWDLGASGYANSFYSAAAQAGSQSWEAWFYGALDSANSITVDKPPAALWLMGLSVRLVGLSSWSILVPEALLGVATAGVLYATIRRVFTAGGPVTSRAHWAGIAGAVTFALTPVATLMFRFNNPDALLVFLTTLASYFVLRAIEQARARWLVGAGVIVGFGFLTKMLQAFLVLPAFVVAYLIAAPVKLGKRILHLLAAFAAMLVSLGWYVAIVELVPTSWRPYIGGSQNNSLLELIIGYNGLGRITGNETGSVGGGDGGNTAGHWGSTGILRMFESVSGGMVSWLIPAALLLTIAALIVRGRRPRTDLPRAALLVFSGSLVVTALVFSFMAGIYHDYYTVALAPAIGGTVAVGFAILWGARERLVARIGMAATVVATTVWAWFLLLEAPTAYANLRWWVGAAGLLATAGLLIVHRLPKLAVGSVIALTLIAGLTGPTAYSINTAMTAHQGSIVTAGPVSGGMGGPGGGRGGAPGGTAPGGTAPGGTAPGGTAPGGTAPGGTAPGGTTQGGTTGTGTGTQTQTDGRGGMGGLINGSNVDAATANELSADASSYTWMAAAIGSQNAASYQLATGYPVMAIGGFNGSDPSPTLAQFQELVAQGKIHWFIAGGGMGGQQSGGSDAAAQINQWVQDNYTATTVGSATVYDLTQAK